MTNWHLDLRVQTQSQCGTIVAPNEAASGEILQFEVSVTDFSHRSEHLTKNIKFHDPYTISYYKGPTVSA